MADEARTVPLLGEHHTAEIHHAVGSLHSFVDLFERVREARYWRLGLLAALNLADCATTIWFLRLGGTEGNPLLGSLVQRWWAPLLVKMVIFVLVTRAVMGSSVRARRVDGLLLAAVLYYLAVVGWNLWIITRLS